VITNLMVPLRAFLLDDPAINTMVGGTRIYPLRLPQNPTLPAIVLTLIIDVREAHLRGAGSIAGDQYQIDSWASAYDPSVALGQCCRLRLAGFKGIWSDPDTSIGVSIQFKEGREFFEADILGGLYRQSSDYVLAHDTAGNTV
jgi:hypothetical protein